MTATLILRPTTIRCQQRPLASTLTPYFRFDFGTFWSASGIGSAVLSPRTWALLRGSATADRRNHDCAREPQVERCVCHVAPNTILTENSQNKPAQLAATVPRRGPPELAIWTQKVREAAGAQLGLTLPYQASPNVAGRPTRRR